MSLPFEFVPSTVCGVRRAVIIGICYEESELPTVPFGHTDALAMKRYLMQKQGFEEANIVLLMDDGESISPTRDNILAELGKTVEASSSGDYFFLYYMGHGGEAIDDSPDSDEADGIDETLCPISGGPIIDDEIFHKVVCKLEKGVTMFAVFDACHSGTIMDLPYSFRFKEDLDNEELEDNRLKNLLATARSKSEAEDFWNWLDWNQWFGSEEQ